MFWASSQVLVIRYISRFMDIAHLILVQQVRINLQLINRKSTHSWCFFYFYQVVFLLWPFTKKEENLNCRHCEHYAELRSPDKVMPDKTVVKGKVQIRQCSKGEFELSDLEPCGLFLKRSPGSHMKIALPPIPPKRGSSVQRQAKPFKKCRCQE